MKLNKLDLSFIQNAVYFYCKQNGFDNIADIQKQTFKKLNDECKKKLSRYAGNMAICDIFDKNM